MAPREQLMGGAMLPLCCEGPPIPAQVLRPDPGTPFVKQGPGLVRSLSSGGCALPDLSLGRLVPLDRRLDRLRGVHLVWSNLFIERRGHEGRCEAIYDDARGAVALVAGYPVLADHAGVHRHGGGLAVALDRLRDAVHVPGTVVFGTPNEFGTWGMWPIYTLPAALHCRANRRSCRKLFVHAGHPNMLGMLALLGLGADDLILHDPGWSHVFEEVHVFRQACPDCAVPPVVADACRGVARSAGPAPACALAGGGLYVSAAGGRRRGRTVAWRTRTR